MEPSRQKPPPTATGRSAFTIIELLVVITIIAVLVALLLPGLGKARDAANDTFCRGNIRQIATAMVTYTHDYGVAPRVRNTPHVADGGFYVVLAWSRYLDDPYPKVANETLFNSGNVIHLRAKGVWRCPSVVLGFSPGGAFGPPLFDSLGWQRLIAEIGAPGDAWYHAAAWLTNYSPSEFTTYDVEPRQWTLWNYGTNYGAYVCQRNYRLSEIQQDSKVLLALDGFAQRYTLPYGFSPTTNAQSWLYRRHDNHFNAAFWDGHAGPVRFGQVITNANIIGERAKLRNNEFPVLRAPHAFIYSDRSVQPIHPGRYP